MDLFIGIIIGAALIGIAWGVSLKLRRPNKGTYLFSVQETDETDVYQDLHDRFLLASSMQQFDDVLRDTNDKKSQLTEKNYDYLVECIQAGITRLEEKAARHAAFKPKMAVLKSITDEEELFDALHQIVTLDGSDITYNDIDEFEGEEEAGRWGRRYDALLIERLRDRFVAARHGSDADFQKAMDFWDELEHFESHDSDDRKEFVVKHLSSEWNEMIVRHKRTLDWVDDLFTLDYISEDDYAEILRKARDERDFLSLRMAVVLGDDSSFTDTLIRTVLQEFRHEAAVQRPELDLESLPLPTF